MPERELHFNVLVMDAGYHESAWRVVDAAPVSVLGLDHYAEIARVAERGRLDSLFFADYPGLAAFRATHMPQPHFDPVELVSALAPLTERIGLIATGSTTYSAPWDVARRLATLHELSHGRAGWNVVTTATTVAAANFGTAGHPPHDERYARAGRFVDQVRAAWAAWGVDPVLAQAGSSPAGIELAARIADVVFTAQPNGEEAIAFRRRLRDAARAGGRSPDAVHVLPGIAFVLGATVAEARERRERLEERASSEFRWRNLLHLSGLDPEGFAPDEPLPRGLLDGPAPTSTGERVFALARRRRELTLREIAQTFAVLPGQLEFTGTPEQLAALIATWLEAGAADGFTLLPTTLPDGLAEFVDHVIPLLQRRGLFRTAYRGATLRAHYANHGHEVAAHA